MHEINGLNLRVEQFARTNIFISVTPQLIYNYTCMIKSGSKLIVSCSTEFHKHYLDKVENATNCILFLIIPNTHKQTLCLGLGIRRSVMARTALLFQFIHNKYIQVEIAVNIFDGSVLKKSIISIGSKFQSEERIARRSIFSYEIS